MDMDILVVTDDPDIKARDIAEALDTAGYQVRAVAVRDTGNTDEDRWYGE